MTSGAFELKPKTPFRLDLTVWTLRRRQDNSVDAWDGATYRRVLPLEAGTVEVAVRQIAPPASARLRVEVTGQPASVTQAAVTSALERLLGLHVDMSEFYKFAARDPRLALLAGRFRGMKPPRFATAFEAVINAIACQQLTLTVGVRLLNRLAAAYGTEFRYGTRAVYSFPCPADLAALCPADLRKCGFSHQKGRAIIELAQSVTTRGMDLERMAELPDEVAVKRLCDLRGVGRWTAEYVLLRGLGRVHVFPGDDVGARNNLQRWLHLAEPLNYEGVRAIQASWGGFAGLVYFHLLLDRLTDAGLISETGSEWSIRQERVQADAEVRLRRSPRRHHGSAPAMRVSAGAANQPARSLRASRRKPT